MMIYIKILNLDLKIKLKYLLTKKLVRIIFIKKKVSL